VLDQAKLTTALQRDPTAVAAIFNSLLGNLGTTTGTGNIASVTGTPTTEHESGTYYVKVVDTSGGVEVGFVTPDGRQLLKKLGTLLPGSGDSSLIPGLRLTASSALTPGQDSFAYSVTNRGVVVGLNDYLKQATGLDGFFDARETSEQAINDQLSQRIDEMQARLKDKEAALNQKFTALETTLARLSAQNNALLSQIAKAQG
jgi:flagellar capping protein FliD